MDQNEPQSDGEIGIERRFQGWPVGSKDQDCLQVPECDMKRLSFLLSNTGKYSKTADRKSRRN